MHQGRGIAVAVLLAIAATAAAEAETHLERMERLSEAVQARLYRALPGGLPDSVDLSALDWDPAMRAAQACVLDVYAARTPPGAVETMLDRLAALADGPEADFRDLSARIEAAAIDLPPDEVIQIDKDCGVIDLAAAQLRRAGLIPALRQAFPDP